MTNERDRNDLHEAMGHARGAVRETLLAIRKMLDAAIDGLDGDDEAPSAAPPADVPPARPSDAPVGDEPR